LTSAPRFATGLLLLAWACGGASSPIVDAGASARDAHADASSTDAAPASDVVDRPDSGDLACDETADCSGVCCAEAESSGPSRTILTTCRDTCITGLPRYRVCKSAAECENGICAAYACGAGAPALRYCDKPDFCD
jgi:hypothetical protein